MLNSSFQRPAAWLLSGLALFALPAARAQSAWPRIDHRPTASAADPTSAVPPQVFSSSLSASAAGIEPGRQDWKRVNQAVGQFPNGHADLLKLETPQQQPAAPAHTHTHEKAPQP